MTDENVHQDPSLEQERRRSPRADLALRGRYMLADRSEYPCQTIDVSSSGIALLGLVKAPIGERVIAYIDGLGRVAGPVTRQFNESFAIEILGAPTKHERVAQRLAWLISHRSGKAPERRANPRVDLDDFRTFMQTPDGLKHPAVVLNFVGDGAALLVDATPDVGCQVMIGQARARVIRHRQDGVAVMFANKVNPQTIGIGRWPNDEAPFEYDKSGYR
jgi:hypothetical protein